MSSEKTRIQNEAVAAYIAHDNDGSVVVGVGGGKTRIGLRIIQYEQQRNNWNIFNEVLVVVPGEDIGNSWLSEMKHVKLFIKLKIVSYKSIENKTQEELYNRYKMIICDELHKALTPARKHIVMQKPRTIGLTGTPELHKIDKRNLINTFLPVFFENLQTEETGVVNKVINYIVMKDLLPAEKKKYDLLDAEFTLRGEKIMEFSDTAGTTNPYEIAQMLVDKTNWNFDKDQAFHGWKYLKAVSARKKFLSQIPSNVFAIEDLVKSIRAKNDPNEKVLIFVNDKNQGELIAKKLNGKLVHSKYDSEINNQSIKDFRDGKITVLLTIDKLGEGVSFPNLKFAIKEGYNSSPTSFTQKRGRLNRMVDTSGEAYLLILMNNNTRQVQWVLNFMKGCSYKTFNYESRKNKRSASKAD